jgi:hypothetical protein
MPPEVIIQKLRNVKAWPSLLGGLEVYPVNGFGICAVETSGFY